MPLAVGNSWTYRWTSPSVTNDAEVSSEKPLFYGRQRYEYGGKGMFALCYRYMARTHDESYTVVRQDGEHFFFEITTSPEVAMDQVRDGRFDSSRENCWTWWQSEGSRGLTESIKRGWTYPGRQHLLDGGAEPEELPADHRNAIHVEWDGPGWHCGIAFSVGGTQVIETYELASRPVTVPAGTFTNCIEVIEEVYDKEKIKKAAGGPSETPEAILIKNREEFLWWRTRTLWAPGVGRVLEYQQLADGTIAYRLELVRYCLSGDKGDNTVDHAR
jgi:hypothetical protein